MQPLCRIKTLNGPRVCRISPAGKEEVYGENDLPKRQGLSSEWKTERVREDASGDSSDIGLDLQGQGKDLSFKDKAKDLIYKAKAKDLIFKAKVKDFTFKAKLAKAKDLTFNAKTRTYMARQQYWAYASYIGLFKYCELFVVHRLIVFYVYYF